MTFPASPAAESLTLADRFHVLVLDITEQLGWQHDALGLELFGAAGRLTSRTAAAFSPYIPRHRALHRDAALRALDDCRTLLDHAGTVYVVDRDSVDGARRHLQALEWLLDTDSAGPAVPRPAAPSPIDPALSTVR